MKARVAKYGIGQVVRHRKYPFRGVVYDVDPTFANTEEWWLSIPEDVRPRKNQPFYHLFAETARRNISLTCPSRISCRTFRASFHAGRFRLWFKHGACRHGAALPRLTSARARAAAAASFRHPAAGL